jgi:signal transduction histidine kinase
MKSPEGYVEPARASDPPIHAPVGFDPFELSRIRAELRLMRFLADLATHLRGTRDSDGAMRFAVRAAKDHFGADAACLAVATPPFQQAQVAFALPQERVWDLPALAQAIGGEKLPTQPNLMFARIRRRDRRWGALALRRAGGEFERAERQALVRIGTSISALIGEIDRDRINEVRDRIDRKIMSELRPIDLSYQILDALRSLMRYDHSSAVLMTDPAGTALEIVAEQIAWRKARSARVGARLPLAPAVERLLREGDVYGFTRGAGGWREWEGRQAAPLAELLDYNDADASEAEVLCAPLRSREGVLGLLKVSACRAETFGEYEAELLTSFVPQVAIAVQNSQRAETLASKVLAAERKHAMAELARGVSHDLNNALGSVLPIVEQMCAEVDQGTGDPKVFADDLRHIERSLHVCRRIFHGMLSFARRSAASVGIGHIRQAIDGALAILEEGLVRRGVQIDRQVAEPMAAVRCAQSDLEQLLLNLLSNARDAMPEGGRLAIRSNARDDGFAELIVQDSGVGIHPENLSRVQEPFFTTKPNGSGLGLAICRSIVSEMRGKLSIESTVARGTCITVLLPIAPG